MKSSIEKQDLEHNYQQGWRALNQKMSKMMMPLSKSSCSGILCYTDTGTGIGYADTHFPQKHQYGDTARIINNYI